MDKRRIVNVGMEISGLVNAAELLALNHSIRERNRIGSLALETTKKREMSDRFAGVCTHDHPLRFTRQIIEVKKMLQSQCHQTLLFVKQQTRP
jgi:hypothetical protein